MKKLFLFAFIVSLALACKSQLVPTELPQQFKGNFFQMKGYLLVDSAVLVKARDTNFRPIAPAILIRKADSSVYFFNMQKWVRLTKAGDALTSEADPTVSIIAKALNSGDTLKWNRADRGRLVSMLFDANSKLLTLARADGSVLTSTINITSATPPPTNLTYSASNSAVTIFSSTGSPTTIPAATSLSAGLFSAIDKSKLEGKLDSVSLVNDTVLVKYRNGSIVDYDTVRIAGVSPTKIRNAQTGDTLMKKITATDFVIKSLLAGSNVNFSRTDTTLTINASGVGGGEATKAFNLGAGLALFKQKSTDTLQFKSITSSYGITATNNTDDVNFKVDTTTISPRGNVGVVAQSLAQLKTLSGNASQYGITLGYFTPGDGGGSLWRWNAASVATSDDFFTAGTGTGRWERIVEDNTVHIRSLGVRADDRTTEVPAIRTAFRAASAKGYSIALDGATVNLNNDTVRVSTFLSLINRGRYTSTPNLTNGTSIFPRAGVRVENLNVTGFTTSVFQWNNSNANTLPINGFTIIARNNRFDNNMRVFQEGSAAGTVDTTATAPRLMNSFIEDNVFSRQGYGSIELEFPYHNLVIANNVFDSSSSPATVRQTVVVGIDGYKNMDKETGLVFRDNIFRNVHSTNASERYTALLSGNRVQAIHNTIQNGSGSLYIRGEDPLIQGNILSNDSAFAFYGIISKDGGGTRTTEIKDNYIIGNYGTGIYIDKRDKFLNIQGNYIDLYDNAGVGDAGIRIIGGDSTYEQIQIENNTIVQRSTVTGEEVMKVSSSGAIRNLSVKDNIFKSELGLIDMRVGGSVLGVQAYNIDFSRNRILKSYGKIFLTGGNLTMKNNEIVYPRGSWNGSAWVTGSYFVALNIRGKADIENNNFYNDTANTASAAKTSELFRILPATGTATGTSGGRYNFRNNNLDLQYAITLLYVEDSTYVSMDGDQVTSVLSAPINFRVDSKIIDFKAKNLYFPATSTFITTGLNAAESVTVDIRNSIIGATNLVSFSGVSQAGLNKVKLTLENNDLSSAVAFGTGWTTRRVQFKRDLNKKSTSSTNYTLVLSDVKGGQVNVVQTTSASPVAVTVPTNATVPFQVGDEVDIQQYAAGAVTVAGAAGVTIQSPNGLATSALYQIVRLRQVAVDTWTAVVAGAGGSGGIASVNHNATLIGDGGTTPLGVDTTNNIGSKPWARKYVLDSIAPVYLSAADFTNDGLTPGTAYGTVANVKSLETATSNGRIVVFNSTSGKQVRDTTLSGVAKLSTGVISTGNINLSTEVTGVLPFDSGGNGYTILTTTTTGTTADIGTIPIPLSTSAIVDLYVVQANTASSSSQLSRVQRRFIKADRTALGVVTFNLQSIPVYDLNSGGYLPTLTASAVATGVKLTVGSNASEASSHTIYYRVWPSIINN